MKHTISEEGRKKLEQMIGGKKTSDLPMVQAFLDLANILLNDKQEENREVSKIAEDKEYKYNPNDSLPQPMRGIKPFKVFAEARKNSITLELPEKYKDDFQFAYSKFIDWIVDNSRISAPPKRWDSNASFLEYWNQWLEEVKTK